LANRGQEDPDHRQRLEAEIARLDVILFVAEHLGEVLDLMANADSLESVRNTLVTHHGLTPLQAADVPNVRLRSFFAKTEVERTRADREWLVKQIAALDAGP
jgi:DNA gyrase/topoisomerase IV subunit A